MDRRVGFARRSAFALTAGLSLSLALAVFGVECDRDAVLSYFDSSVYGPPLPRPTSLEFELFESGEAFVGKARRLQYNVKSRDARGSHWFVALIYVPKGVKGKVPAFVYPNFSGNHTITDDPAVSDRGKFPSGGKLHPRASRLDRVPTREVVVDRGFAFATFCYGDIYPDYALAGRADDDAAPDSVYAIFPEEKLAREKLAHPAWSWGSSRVRDLLETLPEIDQEKVAIAGQSRMGKNATYTGVHDVRFALTCANCGGTKQLRYLPNLMRPYWFSEKLTRHVRVGKACLPKAELDRLAEPLPPPPHDQGEFLGLIAPRALIINGAELDDGLTPEMCAMTRDEARIRFSRFGCDIGYRIRDGKHSIRHDDWRYFMDYARNVLKW